jgi:hypothetical protein
MIAGKMLRFVIFDSPQKLGCQTLLVPLALRPDITLPAALFAWLDCRQE